MAFSYQNYTGDNATDTFAIPFTFTDNSEISVTVDGVAESGLTFPSAASVQLTSAPATGTLVQVRRTTDLTARSVDFASGSVLTEEDLDNSNIQTFHAAQEAVDKSNDGITLGADDKWDAQSKIIKNVADPVDNTDAVNKQFISTNLPNINIVAGIASDVTTVAGISSDVTAVAADATDIGTVATDIANVNINATNIASINTNAANITDIQNASANATTATTKAGEASNFADEAEEWATKTNGIVDSTGYSSKAWATGGTGVTDTAGSGSAKEWATDTTNQVDGTEYSAKEYAIGIQRRGSSGGGSSKDWATYTAGTVDGTLYSAKYYAEQAAVHFDNFDDKYLGSKSSDPTVDNDGNALIDGALYYDTTSNNLKVYDLGTTTWIAITAGATAGFAIAMSVAL
jgi:hypothetical protein